MNTKSAIDALVDYASATGILRQTVEFLLVDREKDVYNELIAKSFVRSVEDNITHLPDSVIELKDRVKEKYNIQ